MKDDSLLLLIILRSIPIIKTNIPKNKILTLPIVSEYFPAIGLTNTPINKTKNRFPNSLDDKLNGGLARWYVAKLVAAI